MEVFFCLEMGKIGRKQMKKAISTRFFSIKPTCFFARLATNLKFRA